jgi:hypothetical protein
MNRWPATGCGDEFGQLEGHHRPALEGERDLAFRFRWLARAMFFKSHGLG